MLNRICTICARGGSKGVPGKNFRPIAGKPLIAWSIEQAKRSALFRLVAVSSDDQRILDAAKAAGADLLIQRPDELATDKAAKLPVILHALLEAEKAAGFEADILVDLDATSPLRSIEDIEACVRLIEAGAGNVITAAPARRSPYFNMVEVDGAGVPRLSKRTEGVVRRQDAPECYDMNASIYAWDRDRFVQDPAIFRDDTQLHVMPEERSTDIDSELDFAVVEMILNNRARESAS